MQRRPLWFWTSAGLMIAAGLFIRFKTAAEESQTYDEAVHIAAGYSYWKTADFRLNPEHPPLSKLLCTIPLLFLPVEFHATEAEWNSADEFAIGKTFLYSNRVPADTILMSTRAVTICLAAVFAIAVTIWVRQRFGPVAALVVLALVSFEPTMVAHSRYVTSDFLVTALYFATCAVWIEAIERTSTGVAVIAGVLAGLTVATKFSGLLVIVILVAVYLAHRLFVKPPRPLRLSRIAIAPVVLPALVTWATYFFTARSMASDPKIGDANDDAVLSAIVRIPIPAYYYFRGVHMLHRYTYVSHPSYFLGRMWNYGSRWYFPVAFLVKTPICLLALLVIALVRFQRNDRRELWVNASILGAAVFYFAVTTNSPLNLGVRHILPVYPLLFLFIAAALSNSRVALLLVAGVVMESAIAYPNYLGFFNFVAGGPAAAPRYLLDSNVDWGQDLKRLASWMRQHNVRNVCLSYFGTADPAYYGISYQRLEPGRDCVRAVSVQHLFTKSEPVFRDLASRKPDEIIGTSIYVFHNAAH